MTVFNVTKTLYNLELIKRCSTVLADEEDKDIGLSPKLKVSEDGGSSKLEAGKEVYPEEVLVCLMPHVAVVNVSGGRAGGKICPFTFKKMFNPVPCQFGSLALFGSEEARQAAGQSFHRFEWSILDNLDKMGLLERTRLALRMVTQLRPEDVSRVAALLGR